MDPGDAAELTPRFDGGIMAATRPVWIYAMDIYAKPSPIDCL